MRKLINSLIVAAMSATSLAGPVDLLYPPTTSSGHDFNHAPIGQSFTAEAVHVQAGIYIADQASFTLWLATIYPGQIAPGFYPFAIAPSITVRMDLLAGETATGQVLYSVTKTLSAPFSGYVDVDYAAAGVALTVGQKYTLLLTDVSSTAYPQGVTGWVVPAVHDPTPGAGQPVLDSSGNVVGYSPFGAYYGGLPILQGAVVPNDAGIGDNAFRVLDKGSATAVQTVSGVNAVITAYAPRNPGFIVINGGQNLLDHLWTTNLNPSNTTFLGGLVNWFQAGLLVDYTGTVTPQGVVLTKLTVKPAPAALAISSATLPSGTVGLPYSAPITVTGGVPPYSGTVNGLPAGLNYDGNNITGTPAVSGISTLTINIIDSLGASVSACPTLSVNAAPAKYTTPDEGKGKIGGLGAGYLLVGTKKIVWNADTVIIVNTPKGKRSIIDSFVKVGMKVQWKGRRDKASGTVLVSKLEIN